MISSNRRAVFLTDSVTYDPSAVKAHLTHPELSGARWCAARRTRRAGPVRAAGIEAALRGIANAAGHQSCPCLIHAARVAVIGKAVSAGCSMC